MKRLIHRKGTPGFSEDVGRVLAGFIYSNARQTSRNLHDGRDHEAVNDIADKTQGELRDQAMKLADYVNNPVEEAHALRGLLFAQYLGGNDRLGAGEHDAAVPGDDAVPVAVGRHREGRCQPDEGALKVAWAKTTGDAKLDAALKRRWRRASWRRRRCTSSWRRRTGKGGAEGGRRHEVGDAAAKANNALSR
jgi:hypothetical protein